MGWKNVREHYGIGHIVKVVDGHVHIGSGYVGSLVTVTPEGRAEVHRTFSDSRDLVRYREQINGDPALFRELMARPDVFAASIPVYTWNDGRIVEKACEEFGWPNVTHDGEIMYENRFFLDRKEAVAHAIRDARAAVEEYERIVAEKRDDLARCEAMLEEAGRHEIAYRLAAMAATPPAP
jgi:hypothetical protein